MDATDEPISSAKGCKLPGQAPRIPRSGQ